MLCVIVSTPATESFDIFMLIYVHKSEVGKFYHLKCIFERDGRLHSSKPAAITSVPEMRAGVPFTVLSLSSIEMSLLRETIGIVEDAFSYKSSHPEGSVEIHFPFEASHSSKR